MEERIKKLENENEDLKNDIIILKKKVQELEKLIGLKNNYIVQNNANNNKYNINIDSVIMILNEFNIISFAIKSRIDKEIKGLKKLYRATEDGDDAINFHSRCDNIAYTLTLIQSAGNRRFGGFASECWESPQSSKYKEDKNAFLFSLDKQKIYPYKNDGKALWLSYDSLPTFGNSVKYSAIFIDSNAIQQKNLYTNESSTNMSYDFGGDGNALSEDGEGKGIYASEIEVFQVIF